MMSSEQPLQGLRVEAFRGFRDRREFDLSGSTIIVTGPNGTGKTSFFDALQWCLLGSIQRLADIRAKRSNEHIVNQFRLGRKAIVELDLLIAGERLTLRRSGDHAGSTLELTRRGSEAIFGAEAEDALRDLLLPNTELALESALTTSGLMQQDVLRLVLESKPAERYQHLATVLGLSQLEEFEQATRALAKDADERASVAKKERDRCAGELRLARERLAVAQSRLESLPKIEAMREQLIDYLKASPPTLEGPDSIDLASPSSVKSLAGRLGVALDAVSQCVMAIGRAQDFNASAGPEPLAEEIGDLTKSMKEAEGDLAMAQAKVQSVEDSLHAARSAATELAQLAALAIPQLTEVCPVCRQTIDAEQVDAELRSRASDTASIVSLQSKLAVAQEAATDTEVRLLKIREAYQAAQARVAQWEQARALRALAQESLNALTSGNLPVRPLANSIDEFAISASSVTHYLTSRRERVLEYLNAFELKNELGVVERFNAQVSSLGNLLADSESILAAENERSRQLKHLRDQSLSAKVEITADRVRHIQPIFENIYQRLDPHPAFKGVELQLDTRYRQGTTSALVHDNVEGVTADPLLVFSTSQANIVALSYFIAMSMAAGERGLPFLLLDDPVQSMDDVNVLGFADLCRHLQSRRQLIVSTHERRFAGLLERKLAPRTLQATTKVISFVGWDRSGPKVDQRLVEPQLIQEPIRVVRSAG
jgi:DNA repair exonuclease SbcCD ATPase subunit